jgi:hypothetical protein
VIVDPKSRIAHEKPPKAAKKELGHFKETIEIPKNERFVSSAYVIYL